MTRYILFILIILSGTQIYSQSENKIWYFKTNAGLDFNSGTPVALTEGQINVGQNSATINNSEGQLLFYSDGTYIWNKNHEYMENSNDLLGDPYAVSLAVPKPESSNLYYLFTCRGTNDEQYGFYSIIDMEQGDEFGAVIEKNTIFVESTSIMLGAVMHSNNTDIWIVAHATDDNIFYSFLLTSEGLSEPVLSQVGYEHHISVLYPYRGALKFSPDGSKAATAIGMSSSYELGYSLELFDFDDYTGQLSNAVSLEQSSAIDIEFSPDNKKLYSTSYNYDSSLPNLYNVYQFNLQAGNTQQIIISRVEIFTGTINYDRKYSMQLGPDGKIYVATPQEPYIDAIQNPNTLGLACNYAEDAVYLGGSNCGAHFPFFLQNYQPAFSYINTCFGEETTFHLDDPTNILSLTWNFGDPASGLNNTSTVFEPNHFYAQAGTYEVTLTITYPDGPHVVTKTLSIDYSDALDLGADQQVCAGESLILDTGSSYASYLWSNGSHNESITVSQAGSYWCEVESGSGCHSRDTVMVSVLPSP
ncbi:MAG: PKD domain-containing protein, partial [Bacteroidales bacterium]|nr:PKD domain-containing protein [Bacteroidales bacterium]